MFEALYKYAVFSGRARRKEFWLFILLSIIAGIVAGVIDGMIGTTVAEIYGIFGLIVTLGLLIPGIAVSVRRLHDRNLRGWWLLIYFTGIGAIVLLVMYCMRGTVGENRFGDDPLANE